MLEKIDFPEPGMIFLVQGKISPDRPYWAYVMMPLEKIPEYYRAKERGDKFDLQEYGYIICWEEEESPPKEVRDEMAEVYGVREDFAEVFVERLKKAPGGQDFIERVNREMAKLKPENN